MFEPVDDSLFDDFVKLLNIKRKPNKNKQEKNIDSMNLVGCGSTLEMERTLWKKKKLRHKRI